MNSGQFALARLTKVRFGDQVVGVLSGMEMMMGRRSELRDVFVVQSEVASRAKDASETSGEVGDPALGNLVGWSSLSTPI